MFQFKKEKDVIQAPDQPIEIKKLEYQVFTEAGNIHQSLQNSYLPNFDMLNSQNNQNQVSTEINQNPSNLPNLDISFIPGSRIQHSEQEDAQIAELESELEIYGSAISMESQSFNQNKQEVIKLEVKDIQQKQYLDPAEANIEKDNENKNYDDNYFFKNFMKNSNSNDYALSLEQSMNEQINKNDELKNEEKITNKSDECINFEFSVEPFGNKTDKFIIIRKKNGCTKPIETQVELKNILILRDILQTHFFDKVLPYFEDSTSSIWAFGKTVAPFKKATDLQIYLNKLVVKKDIQEFPLFIQFLENQLKFEEEANIFMDQQKFASSVPTKYIQKMISNSLEFIFKKSKSSIFEKERIEVLKIDEFLKKMLKQLNLLLNAAKQQMESKKDIASVLVKINAQFPGKDLYSEESVIKSNERNGFISQRYSLIFIFLSVIEKMSQDVVSCKEACDRAQLIYDRFCGLGEKLEDPSQKSHEKELIAADLEKEEIKVRRLQTILKKDIDMMIASLKLQIKKIFDDQFVVMMKQLSFLV